MLRIAGKTTGPIGLKFFVDTHGWLRGVISFIAIGLKIRFFLMFFFLFFENLFLNFFSMCNAQALQQVHI